MDPQLIQRSRYILRSRIRRVQTCPSSLFPSACQHLIDWLKNHPIFSSLVGELGKFSGENTEKVKKVISGHEAYSQTGGIIGYSAATLEEHAAICWIITNAIASGVNESYDRELYTAIDNYINCEMNFAEIDKAISNIRDVAIEGLYEYLDERLDSRNVIYGLLLKYKERSEWFRRLRLRNIADEGLEGKTGERALAIDLQEYVFDQQVEFIIEPVSSSGEADLILRDPEGRYIILDAKYIKEDSPRSEIVKKIRDGFHQLYRYQNDYNEPEGFLVVFLRTTKRITLKLDNSDGLRFLNLGGKIIYYLEVQISQEPSASLSGRAEEVHISREEMVTTETGE